ncbi:TRAP transporter substrate-binding protein DctP [Pokkaliibacter sp. CJK22405]|uniref:TRAP transporter substrate-binding protein DctP n=1 Tax=Pokkaliibacter sp. CJK22405 TaxID=3384615 RepID=UPI00398508DC
MPRFNLSLKRTHQALLAVTAALLVSQSQAATVLTYVDAKPVDEMRTRFLEEVFFPAVERESEGRLKIERHWNGGRDVAFNALASLAAGKSDLGVVAPEYEAKSLPLNQIFQSFPVGPAGAKEVAFYRQVYQSVPAFNAELGKQHLHEIFLAPGYPAAFFAAQPQDNIRDIAGRSWRTSSFWHASFLTSAGATPTKVRWGPDIAAALEKGSLSGIFVNIDSAKKLSLQKAAPYVLASPRLWMDHLYIIAMNETSWEALSAEDQAAFTRAAASSYPQYGQRLDEAYTRMIASFKADGATVHTLSDAELSQWMQASNYQQHQQEWATSAALKGSDANTVLEQVSGIFSDYQNQAEGDKSSLK